MDMLNSKEWEQINRAIYDIYLAGDSRTMREHFLKNVWSLIGFQVGEFSLVAEDHTLFDSVEINMLNNERFDIATKYNEFKLSHKNEITDYIFQHPESFVAADCNSGFNSDRLKKTAFHTIFLQQISMKHGCTLTVRNKDRLIGLCSLYYSTEPDFDERDVYILTQLKDHLTLKMNQLSGSALSMLPLPNAQLDYLMSKGVTRREIEIISLLIEGEAQKNIADAIGISENTIKKHIYNIYKKLGVHSSMQLYSIIMNL